MGRHAAPDRRTISVFLADDNLIVREGVRALIERIPDLAVVGLAADYDEVMSGCADRAAGARHRRANAAVLPPRGHRSGQ
jgi:hypothetical protein